MNHAVVLQQLDLIHLVPALHAHLEPAPARETRTLAAPAPSAAPAATSAQANEDPVLLEIITKVSEKSKFLGTLVEQSSTWLFENGEVTFVYAQKDSYPAELIKGREQMEMLRTVCTQVLGKPVKICVRLEEQGVAARPGRPSARERAERDQVVEAFRKKFDGTVVDVKDLSRE